MEYEWEARITPATLEYIEEVINEVGLTLVGLAVVHPERVEGALISVHQPEGSIARADVWQDILGDCTGQYDAAKDAMQDDFERRHRPN